jgi:hypothetical protein
VGPRSKGGPDPLPSRRLARLGKGGGTKGLLGAEGGRGWADKVDEEVMTHCSNNKVERSGKTKFLNL